MDRLGTRAKLAPKPAWGWLYAATALGFAPFALVGDTRAAGRDAHRSGARGGRGPERAAGVVDTDEPHANRTAGPTRRWLAPGDHHRGHAGAACRPGSPGASEPRPAPRSRDTRGKPAGPNGPRPCALRHGDAWLTCAWPLLGPAPRAHGRGTTRIADIMTPAPVAADAGATIEEATRMRLDHRIGGLPVVHRGLLVGIVTQADLVDRLRAAQARATVDGGHRLRTPRARMPKGPRSNGG